MVTYSNNYQEFTCKDTDEKPIENVNNGDRLLEITSSGVKKYIFDKEESEWIPWEATE